MGGMNLCKEIPMKIYGWTVNRTRNPCIIGHMLYRSISTVHLARTTYTTHAPCYVFVLEDTHTPNTSLPLPCHDLLNAWTRKATSQNEVGMGRINIYKGIQMKIYGWTGSLSRNPFTSQVLYHWSVEAVIHGPSNPNDHNNLNFI